MSNKNLILDLAKLVISAAWADGELCNDEVNALKDLLFRLDRVSGADWSVLTMYIESPVSEAEHKELLERVLKAIQSSEDKALAIETLENLFQCDGKVTAEEEDLLKELRSEISAIDTGIFSGLSRALKSAILQRRTTVKSSYLREQDLDDYVLNTIYYDLTRQLKDSEITFDLPEEVLRKLCLATGLLSHIANVDSDISSEEREAMHRVIAEDWALSNKQAALLVDISCKRTTRGLDYVRLSNGYFDCTTLEERRKFLKTLFRIANAANKTDYDEIEEIRRVANSLKLLHRDFIDAKLTISSEDRRWM